MTHNQFLCELHRLQRKSLKQEVYSVQIYTNGKYISVAVYTFNEDSTVRFCCSKSVFQHTSSEEIEIALNDIVAFINKVRGEKN